MVTYLGTEDGPVAVCVCVYLYWRDAFAQGVHTVLFSPDVVTCDGA